MSESSQPILSVDIAGTGISDPNHPLHTVQALTFDVFGTVVDWLGSVVRQLEGKAKATPQLHDAPGPVDWTAFAKEWREGYYQGTRRIAAGGEGSNNVDVMHREILDAMLASPKWAALRLGEIWGDKDREEMVGFWHSLDGWPDSTEGLYLLKKKVIIATLSNGNVRLLVDMAKHADLPWDVIFSGELLGSYKPNPKTYLGACHHLSLPPSQVAMVAAHIADLRAAASFGMKTIYVRRPTEDLVGGVRDGVKSKKEGGEVDVVVDSFVELAELLE